MLAQSYIMITISSCSYIILATVHICHLTLLHLRSKAQAMLQSVVGQNIHTIPTGIHYQQQEEN